MNDMLATWALNHPSRGEYTQTCSECGHTDASHDPEPDQRYLCSDCI